MNTLTRDQAAARVLSVLSHGPATATELSLTALRRSGWDRATPRNALLADLLTAGRVELIHVPAGPKLRPVSKYRLPAGEPSK